LSAEIEQERNERESSEEQAGKLQIQIEKLKKGLAQLKKQKEEVDTNVIHLKSELGEVKHLCELEKQKSLKERVRREYWSRN